MRNEITLKVLLKFVYNLMFILSAVIPTKYVILQRTCFLLLILCMAFITVLPIVFYNNNTFSELIYPHITFFNYRDVY